MMAQILTLEGFEADTATDGADALTQLQASGPQPDVILLDLHLPDIAGDAVLGRLRRDDRTREIPVIVLSADAIPAQVERLLAQGIVDYVTKPIEIERFLGAMRRALGRT